MKRKALSVILVIFMIASVSPVAVFAGGDWETFDFRAFSDGLACIKRESSDTGTSYGYMDITGKMVIDFKYQRAGDFNDGIAPVVLNNKCYFINKSGEVVIDFIYEVSNLNFFTNYKFIEGLLAVKKDGKYGFIDKTGKVVIDFIYNNAHNFSEGLALVSDSGYSKTGFIDKTGKVVIPLENFNCGDFSDGLSYICRETPRSVKVGEYYMSIDEYGYIDKTGKLVIPFEEYVYVTSFNGGVAGVSWWDKDGNIKYGAIDKTGKIVVPLQYDSDLIFNGGIATIIQKDNNDNNRYGLVDKTGKTIVPLGEYQGIGMLSDGFLKIYKDGKYGFIDNTGKLVIPLLSDYYSANDFSEGLSQVYKNNIGYGFIDKTGKGVIECIYAKATDFKCGHALASKDGTISRLEDIIIIPNPLTGGKVPEPTPDEIIYGDINGDGKVNVADLICLSQHLSGAKDKEITDPDVLKLADVNGDGELEIKDLVRLAQWLAEIDSTPLGQS